MRKPPADTRMVGINSRFDRPFELWDRPRAGKPVRRSAERRSAFQCGNGCVHFPDYKNMSEVGSPPPPFPLFIADGLAWCCGRGRIRLRRPCMRGSSRIATCSIRPPMGYRNGIGGLCCAQGDSAKQTLPQHSDGIVDRSSFSPALRNVAWRRAVGLRPSARSCQPSGAIRYCRSHRYGCRGDKRWLRRV
jgi:hypothetical protein